MRIDRGLPALGLLTVLIGAGCAAEPEPVFVPINESVIEYRSEAVVTDEAFERDVEVLPAAFRIAKSTASASLGGLKVGSIVVAESHLNNPNNPYGMLRRVTAVQDVGTAMEFATEEADILDAATSADINLDSDTAVYDMRDWADESFVQLVDPEASTQLGTQSLGLLADPPPAKPAPPGLKLTGKNGSFSLELPERSVLSSGSIAVKAGASLKVKPGFKAKINLFDCKYHGWASPLCVDFRNLDFVGEFNFKPKADITAEASLSLSASEKVSLLKKEIEFVKPKKVLTFSVSGIPMQLHAAVVGTCEASTSASVEAKIVAHAEIHPEAEVGFSNKGGWVFKHDLDKGAKFEWKPSLAGKVGFSAKCSIQVKIELRIAGFPVRGPHAALGPYIKGDTVANCPTRITLEPGLEASFGVDETKLDLKLKKFTLPKWTGHSFDIPFKALSKEVGLACKNDCTGKPDGFLCTSVAAGSMDVPTLVECAMEKVVTSKACPNECSTPITAQDQPICK
jgi:hypothetical protein